MSGNYLSGFCRIQQSAIRWLKKRDYLFEEDESSVKENASSGWKYLGITDPLAGALQDRFVFVENVSDI